MRHVYIDSESHYQLKADDGKLVLIEYITGDHDDECNILSDLCPSAGARDPFLPSEGKVIEEFCENEEIEFIYSSFEANVMKEQASDTIVCGDNLRQHFSKKKENDEASNISSTD